MSKELFVSTTPHETKVGLVEDDLLAEIYLERENEYTLAGSIYKGRVTRVLPGMQSAFVDIGLERDAFLYVSDFMELEDHEDLDDVPTTNGRAPAEASQERQSSRAENEAQFQRQARASSGSVSEPQPHSSESLRNEDLGNESEDFEQDAIEGVSQPTVRREASNRDAADVEPLEGERDSGGGWRGRRRRRGRRGERMPESKFARPATVSAAPTPAPVETRTERNDRTERNSRPERNDRSSRGERPERAEYGPPAGYQPILLPGESISKYARLNQKPVEASSRTVEKVGSEPPQVAPFVIPIAPAFADDEPLFAGAPAQEKPPTAQTTHGAAPLQAQHIGPADVAPLKIGVLEIGSDEWDREQKRRHEANVAAVFGESARKFEAQPEAAPSQDAAAEVKTYEFHDEDEDDEDSSDRLLTLIPTRVDLSAVIEVEDEHANQADAFAGATEEEEIDEEEADFSHYVEDLEEDAAFEEMEEEIQNAEDHREGREIAAMGNPPNGLDEAGLLSSFAAGIETPEAMLDHPHVLAEAEQAGEETEEEDFVEAEIEEAQAEAEAILDAEALGNGTVDARVEVRAPSATAAYTQRAARPAYDRRGGGQRNNRRPGNSGRSKFRRNEQQNVPLITDLLKEGQEILVQIAKEPIGKKGARITSHIALPGRFLVYMPTVNHTGVSRKIGSEEERQRLKRIIISERDTGQGGFIVRTAAQGAAEEELRADVRFLKGLWSEIKTRAEAGKSPALIYHDLNVVERVLRDQVTSDFSTIWVDTEHEFERVLRFANRFQPGLVRKVKLYSKEIPLFEQFGLSEEINKALKSKVWLKSGGYIVINQTEALVAIDVNTGKYVGKTTRLEDTIVKTNVDAIKEIVRQIRLRDLGGIIIIDFIDMDERRNRQKVMLALEDALRSDRAPSKVLQFNDFGLVAITRKRVKQSLERTIGTPCPYCESTGYVKSVTTVCNDIYIEMRKMVKHLERADVMLRVNPDVGKALKANNGKALLEMEEMTKKTVIIKSDPALHQEQFDIN